MATTVDIQLDRRALARVTSDSASQVSDQVADTTARRVRANIASAGRVGTGAMLNSVRVVRRSPTEFAVIVDVDYAMFQEEGVVGPVRPVRAKVLRFTVGGTVVYAKQTRGFSGAHFMRDALASLNQRDVHR